jgi:AcrR family transcriptional regulator
MPAAHSPGGPVDHDLHDRRRGEILAVARHVAEHGCAGVDVRELADALGIANGTVFRSFPTKRGRFAACLESALVRLAASIDAAATRRCPARGRKPVRPSRLKQPSYPLSSLRLSLRAVCA